MHCALVLFWVEGAGCATWNARGEEAAERKGRKKLSPFSPSGSFFFRSDAKEKKSSRKEALGRRDLLLILR